MAFLAIAGLLALLVWFVRSHQARSAELRELFDGAPVAYHELDRDGVVRRVNQTECALLGYQAGEMLGRPIWEFVAAGEQADSREAIRRKLSGEQPLAPVQRRFVRRDGAELSIEIHDRLVRKEIGEATGIRSALLDITARVAAEQRIQRYLVDLEAAREALSVEKERAEAATRAKSEFLSSMSHEIRTPMNGVIGMTELLLDTPLTAEQMGYAETVRDSGEALLGIITDILDFSKMEAGRLKLEMVPFDLRHTLEDAVGLLAAKAREKNLELLLSYAQDAPREFMGDPRRIRQVVLNLTSNAIKFTERGHVLVDAGSQAGPGGGTFIRIAVHDTGIGIPADRQGLLFQKFQQLDSSTTRKYGGTGLGLAISRQIAELMGGTLSLTSEVGVGSTFSFEIPLRAKTTEPVFEKAAFLSRIMGDEDLARSITGAFLDDMPAQIERLASAVAAGDTRKVELQAHQIKGASANVGGEALRGAAGEMEETSKAGRLEALRILLPRLQERFAQLKEAMEKDAGKEA